jgi:hypothetical protein
MQFELGEEEGWKREGHAAAAAAAARAARGILPRGRGGGGLRVGVAPSGVPATPRRGAPLATRRGARGWERRRRRQGREALLRPTAAAARPATLVVGTGERGSKNDIARRGGRARAHAGRPPGSGSYEPGAPGGRSGVGLRNSGDTSSSSGSSDRWP